MHSTNNKQKSLKYFENCIHFDLIQTFQVEHFRHLTMCSQLKCYFQFIQWLFLFLVACPFVNKKHFSNFGFFFLQIFLP